MANAKHDYTEFDQLMLQLIKAGRPTARGLEAALEQQIKPFVTKLLLCWAAGGLQVLVPEGKQP